jgi:hypothetical protein
MKRENDKRMFTLCIFKLLETSHDDVLEYSVVKAEAKVD